jgi:hypothetical protein
MVFVATKRFDLFEDCFPSPILVVMIVMYAHCVSVGYLLNKLNLNANYKKVKRLSSK